MVRKKNQGSKKQIAEKYLVETIIDNFSLFLIFLNLPIIIIYLICKRSYLNSSNQITSGLNMISNIALKASWSYIIGAHAIAFFISMFITNKFDQVISVASFAVSIIIHIFLSIKFSDFRK